MITSTIFFIVNDIVQWAIIAVLLTGGFVMVRTLRILLDQEHYKNKRDIEFYEQVNKYMRSQGGTHEQYTDYENKRKFTDIQHKRSTTGTEN